MRTGSALLLILLGAGPMPAQTPSSPAPRLDPATRLDSVRPLDPARPSGPLAPDLVAGRVLSSVDKHALARATVTLREQAGRRPVASVRTDAEGRYAFAPQAAGKYNLQASAPGYLGSSYLEHEGLSTAIVLGAGLKTDDLVLQLTPSAVINGRVVDQTGDAVQHASITLFREDSNASPRGAAKPGPLIVRTRTAQTDEDGSFEFTGVMPGRFYLSASAAPWFAVHPRPDADDRYVPYRVAVDPALDVAYPEIFYPHATSPEDAAPFPVKAGDRITADMVMQPEHALTLSFRLPAVEPGQPLNFRYPQLSRTIFGVEQPVAGQNMMGDGRTLSMTGLLPGHYNLRQSAPNSRFTTEIGGVDLGQESVTMDLPADTSTTGASLSVALRDAKGTALPPGLHLLLRRTENRVGPAENRPVEKGMAEFGSLPPGDYRFTALGEGHTYTVLALSQDGKPAPDRQVHLGGSGAVKAELTLSLYAPTLEGFAQHDGKAVAGSTVILVPAGADTAEDLFRRDQSDLDGSFVLPNVVPGNYLLVAIEQGWTVRWNDPDALLPYLLHGLPVSVPVSGPAKVPLADPLITQPVK